MKPGPNHAISSSSFRGGAGVGVGLGWIGRELFGIKRGWAGLGAGGWGLDWNEAICQNKAYPSLWTTPTPPSPQPYTLPHSVQPRHGGPKIFWKNKNYLLVVGDGASKNFGSSPFPPPPIPTSPAPSQHPPIISIYF